MQHCPPDTEGEVLERPEETSLCPAGENTSFYSQARESKSRKKWGFQSAGFVYHLEDEVVPASQEAMNLANRKTKRRFRIQLALPWPEARRDARSPSSRPGGCFVVARTRQHPPGLAIHSHVHHPGSAASDPAPAVAQEPQAAAGASIPSKKPQGPHRQAQSSPALLPYLLTVFTF